MPRSSVFISPVSCCLSSSLLVTAILFILVIPPTCSADYYGKLIGKLSEFHHSVSGEVYAVDGRTLYIKDFIYDGEGPAAFFYAGNSKGPNGNGFRIRDERGTTDVLKRYRKKDITLTLPEGKTLNNIKWFSVYCDEFAVNFGDVRIPRGFDYPRPQKLAALNGVHGVKSEPVVVVDTQTLLIPGFSYDGEAPDAKFWVGSGPHPSPQGIRVPDENGKHEPLRRYDHKTIVLTLPGDLTVHQLGHFGVWCEAFTVDFGHIQIHAGLNVPPSLKMLGVSPQSKLNCEVLQDSLAFEVRWAVAGDSIVVQLVGKLDGEQYMSFGLSTSPERSLMVGGDVVVAWVDKRTLQGHAVDYFLDAKSQCSGGRGSCPDTRIQNNTNSVRLLNAAMVNGYSIVTYQRPLEASDELDRQIRTNGSQAIIWAVGPLNERQEVSFHSHYLKTDRFIEFGRPPSWNCPMPDGDMPHTHIENVEKENKQQLAATTRRPQSPVPTPASAATKDAWVIPPIQCDEPEDGVFFAQMGPTGGKHGYPAITGHVGWGISWYINGLLIPEINVVRGKKYTFVVEGGEDPEIPARYHPFYITDDPVGGYQHKTPEEKANVQIFAGVRRHRGTVRPTGVGRLCNWMPDPNLPLADDFESFGAYQRTLTLKCDPGEPGFVEWTPDENTPDIVYYQCFTHRYLGWKINVLDSCDKSQGAASETQEVYIQPGQIQEGQELGFKSSPSIRATSKVAPDPVFYHHHHHPHIHYTAVPNKKFAMNFAGKLILTNSYNNNNNNNNNNNKNNINNNNNNNNDNTIYNNNNKVQLIRTGGHGVGGIEVGYEQRNPYGMMQSYGEHDHSFLVRSPLHESTKYMQQNQYHYHRHHLPPLVHENAGMRTQGHMERGGFPDGRLHGATGRASNSASGNIINLNQHLANHQSSPMTVGIIASPNQLSNLIPDKRPIMSHRQTKFAYSNPGFAQYIYSRLSQSHPHTTHPMTLRRQMIQPPAQIQPERRTILRSIIMSNGGRELAPQPQSSFEGRKKSAYPGSSHVIVKSSGPKKSHKLKNKQQSKIETKVSSEADVLFVDQSLGSASVTKSARNTGFDPDSIVIERGFKPIVRNLNRESNAGENQQFTQNLESSQMNDVANAKKKIEEWPEDENNAMFVPTSLGRNNITKPSENMIIRVLPIEAKMRLNEFDDMEMAADRLDSYYLPPSGSSIVVKKVDDRISSSTLIAFDGKRVNDSSLTRSKPKAEVKQPRSRLTSDVLSRTPQFGRFKGELPPPIPVNVRIENIPQLELRRVERKYLELPQSDRATTKQFERARRSTQLQKVDEVFDIFEKTNSSQFYEHTDYNDYDNTETSLSSTGQVFITNIQYVFLTIVLYFAI